MDDDRDARCILREVLTHVGALVTTAASAKDALAHLRAVLPDVVVTDMLLGPGDGLQLVTDAQRTGRRTPFIAISAADFDVRQLTFVGFAAYLRKPLDYRQLVHTIAAVARPSTPPVDERLAARGAA